MGHIRLYLSPVRCEKRLLSLFHSRYLLHMEGWCEAAAFNLLVVELSVDGDKLTVTEITHRGIGENDAAAEFIGFTGDGDVPQFPATV